jgi:hypothetical protein
MSGGSVGRDECSKVERVGRITVVCHLPLHHEAVRFDSGRLVRVHEGLLNGKLHTWEDDDE